MSPFDEIIKIYHKLTITFALFELFFVYLRVNGLQEHIVLAIYAIYLIKHYFKTRILVYKALWPFVLVILPEGVGQNRQR